MSSSGSPFTAQLFWSLCKHPSRMPPQETCRPSHTLTARLAAHRPWEYPQTPRGVARWRYQKSISKCVEYATHSVKIVSHTKVQSLLDQVRPFNKICIYICLNKNIVNKFNSIFVFVIDNRNRVSRFRVLYIRNGDRALSEGYDCCLCRTLSAGICSWQVIDNNI